jgi:hypothetical protein
VFARNNQTLDMQIERLQACQGPIRSVVGMVTTDIGVQNLGLNGRDIKDTDAKVLQAYQQLAGLCRAKEAILRKPMLDQYSGNRIVIPFPESPDHPNTSNLN